MYKQTYREIEVIGKGNFGSATLVQRLHDNTEQLLVAKKIILDKLGEKERLSALREAELLKSLRHPNIVSYVDSFIHDGTLIIIMEHCEGKRGQQYRKRGIYRTISNDYFPEKLILNWFLQILFALQYIHHKRILHRDIKSSNIFLTSNGTVKIGDFGISKVLENTLDQASTVVGTPYYMSPEVCENKPYTFKSDVWALGCVLYELCTLKHAFDANNLLGLIFKIMREQIDHIPSLYSKDLQALIHKLLSKSAAVRPIIPEIINLPFIQSTMQEFVISGGRQSYISTKKILSRKQSSEEENKEERKDEQEQSVTIKSIENASRFTMGDTVRSQTQGTSLTPKELAKLRKDKEVEQKQQELMRATQQVAQQNKTRAELSRIQHLHGTGSQFYREKEQQLKVSPNKVLTLDISLKGESVFIKADTPLNQIRALSEQESPENKSMMESQLLRLKLKQQAKQRVATPPESDEDQYSANFEEYGYEDDFEPYDESEEKVENQSGIEEDIQLAETRNRQSQRDLDEVLELYRNELARTHSNPGLNDIAEDSQEDIPNGSLVTQSTGQERIISNLRKSVIQQLGLPMFKKVYEYIKISRKNEVEDPKIRSELVKVVGKENMNACFNIDQLIYWEQQLQV